MKEMDSIAVRYFHSQSLALVDATFIFVGNKSMHPAAQLLEPPSILLPYDTRTDSGCLNIIHNHYQFFSTDIGCVIRELNSPLGVPLVTFHALLSHATTCGSCLCTFSVDGYNSHIRQGQCDNHPYMEKGTVSTFRLNFTMIHIYVRV